jgi:ATP-dependent RNA helicase DOB1
MLQLLIAQKEKGAPELERQADELQREAMEVKINNEAAVSEFHTWKTYLDKTNYEISSVIHQPEHALPFLQNGRLLHVVTDSADWGWSVLINLRKISFVEYNSAENKNKLLLDRKGAQSTVNQPQDFVFVLDVLLEASRDSDANLKPRTLTDDRQKQSVADVAIVQASLNAISSISAVRLNLPKV